MANQPWFKLYAGDTIMDAKLQKCPLDAQALIFRMWCIHHIEGSCPADTEELAIAIRCRIADVSRNESFIKSFFELRDGRYYSTRMEAEKRRSEINRLNKVGGGNKELTGFDSQVVERIVKQTPDSDYDNQKKKFLEVKAEEIYKEYPRKVGKPAAIKAIKSALERERHRLGGGCDVPEYLTRKTRMFAKSPAGNAGSFTPHPATWFNQERYNDDESTWQRADKQPVVSDRPSDSWMTYDPNRPSVYGGNL